MPSAKKPKVPPSPLTGLYVVKNRGGVYLKRGSHAECVKYADAYAADRKARRLPPDATEVLPERLWIEARGIRQLLPDVAIPVSCFAVEASAARPTGSRTKQWWGGMEGGPAWFEEWEATPDDSVAAVAGLRFRCYRSGTSELDRSPGHYLIAVELLSGQAAR